MSASATTSPLGATVTAVIHVRGPRTVVMIADAHDLVIHVGATLRQGGRSWTVVGVASACGGHRDEVGLVVRGDGDPSVGPVDFQEARP